MEYRGQVDVSLGAGDTRSVTAIRTHSFSVLQNDDATFGVNIGGLLGLSTIGRRRILFDVANVRMLLGPLG